jgi:hypothetical protein
MYAQQKSVSLAEESLPSAPSGFRVLALEGFVLYRAAAEAESWRPVFLVWCAEGSGHRISAALSTAFPCMCVEVFRGALVDPFGGVWVPRVAMAGCTFEDVGIGFTCSATS